MDKKFDYCLNAMIAFVLIAAGAFVGVIVTAYDFRDQAIERGFAEYDSKTGEWQWKEHVPDVGEKVNSSENPNSSNSEENNG